MSYSTQRTTSDGTLVALDISIEYFDRSEITIYFDNILNKYPWSWVGTTDKKIKFTPAVPAGVKVMLLRTTDLAEVRHQFAAGAAFTYGTLDEDMLQILHIAQEARENAVITEVFQDFDLHGYKLLNLGLATQPGDAVALGQFKAHDDTIIGYKDQAEAAANRAEIAAATTPAMEVQIHQAPTKNPDAADEFGFWDSVSNKLRRVTYANLLSSVSNLANTWSLKQIFENWMKVQQACEKVNIVGTAPTATQHFDADTGAIVYHVPVATLNWTLNIRGDSTHTLDSRMSVGETLTISAWYTMGTTAYKPTAFNIDGKVVVPKWIGGTAPAGDASSVNIYTFTILKTGTEAYLVVGSKSKAA